MKQIVPRELFKSFRIIPLAESQPSDDAVNTAFEAILNDMGQNDEAMEKMMKFDSKKRWAFIQAQAMLYEQQPSPECFVKYITMNNYQYLNVESLTSLHFMLKQGSISWGEEFIIKQKGHMILINKILQYDTQDKFKNLHTDKKDLEFFKYIFACIGDIENLDSGQKELLNEKRLLPALFKALSIQNDEVFVLVLEDLIPFVLFTENADKISHYFEGNNLYTIIGSILKREPDLVVVKCIVPFLNALFVRYDKISAKVNFILQLQKESIFTQLRTLKIAETEKVYSGRAFFLKNVDDILVPLSQVFPPSKNINPFKEHDVHKYLQSIVGEKVDWNMSLALIEIECQNKRQFPKIYQFLSNFLTLFRQYQSRKMHISIDDTAYQALHLNSLYNPGSNATFTEDFYKKLYKKTSFVPSIVLKDTNVPVSTSSSSLLSKSANQSSDASELSEEVTSANEELKTLREENQKLTKEMREKEQMIQALQLTVQSFQTQFDTFTRDKKAIQSQLDQANKELELLKSGVASQSSKRTSTKASKDDITITQLKASLEVKNKEKEDLQNENKNLQDQIMKLSSERDQIKNKVQDLASKVSLIETLKLENQRSREEINRQKETYEEQKNAFKSQIQSLQNQITALKSQNAKAIQEREELQNLMDQNKRETNQISQLTSDNASLTKQIEDLKKQLSNSEREVSNAKAEAASALEQLKQKQQQQQQSNAASAVAAAASTSASLELEKKNKKLTDKLEAVKKQLRDEKSKAEQQISQIKNQLDDKSRQLDEITRQLEEAQQKISLAAQSSAPFHPHPDGTPLDRKSVV